MTTFILTLAGTVTSSNGYSVNSRSAQKHLSDQLLSLWMNGDSLSSDSLTSNSNSKGVDQNNDESMRKVLEFLTNKASEKDSNR